MKQTERINRGESRNRAKAPVWVVIPHGTTRNEGDGLGVARTVRRLRKPGKVVSKRLKVAVSRKSKYRLKTKITGRTSKPGTGSPEVGRGGSKERTDMTSSKFSPLVKIGQRLRRRSHEDGKRGTP